MRYLLTGGEGFVGRHVANALISHGHDVVLATRRDVPDENRPYELLHLDISRSDQDIYNIAGKPDVVIDMAWEDGFNHGSDKHLKNANDHIVFIENLLKGGLKALSWVRNISRDRLSCWCCNGEHSNISYAQLWRRKRSPQAGATASLYEVRGRKSMASVFLYNRRRPSK